MAGLTRFLKLRLSTNLTPDARYNLERIDLLGTSFNVDTTDELDIRSRGDVRIEAQSPDIGGSGTGGTVFLGDANNSSDTVRIDAATLLLNSAPGLLDQGAAGTRYLNLRYKSDVSGSTDTAADRTLSVDAEGADRNLILAGDLHLRADLTSGSHATQLNTTGSTEVTLPTSGILATRAGAEVLTNKTINASSNTVLNIANANIAVGANITRSKLAAGSADHVLVNDNSGVISSEAQLAASRGGTGVSSTATFPTSGVIVTEAAAQTLMNKIIAAGANTITGLTDDNFDLAASISRDKIAASSANHVVINDISGKLATEAQLSRSRGGTGVNSTATFPLSGVIVTRTAAEDLSNKTHDALRLRGGTSGQVTLQSNIGTYTLTMPPDAGSGSQVLARSGPGNLVWASLITDALDTAHVDIGDADNERIAVNTATTGEIAASSTTGLSIKSGVIDNDRVAADAAIARSKLSTGTADHVVINTGDGTFASEAQLAKSRGGAGADMSSVTFPATGNILNRTDATTPENNQLMRWSGANSGKASSVTVADDGAFTGIKSITHATGSHLELRTTEANRNINFFPNGEFTVGVSTTGLFVSDNKAIHSNGAVLALQGSTSSDSGVIYVLGHLSSLFGQPAGSVQIRGRGASGAVSLYAGGQSVLEVAANRNVSIGAPADISAMHTIYGQASLDRKFLRLNAGGAVDSGAEAGVYVFEDGVSAGNVSVSADRNSWVIKAPGSTGVVTVLPGASGFTLNQGSHNPVSIGTANGLSLSTQELSLAAASGAATGALTSADWTRFDATDTEVGAVAGDLVGTTDTQTLSNKTFNTDTAFDSTGAITLPVGNNAARPTPATGMTRFNSELGIFEGYDGSNWGSLGGSADVVYNLAKTTIGDIGDVGQIRMGHYIVADSVKPGTSSSQYRTYNLTSLNDSSGNDDNLTQAGSEDVVFGGDNIFGAAEIAQCGVDKKLTNDDAFWSLTTGPFSFSTWVFLSSTANGQVIFEVEGASSEITRLSTGIGTFIFTVFDSSFSSPAVEAAHNGTGWYHIAGMVIPADETLYLWVNGELVTSTDTLDADLGYTGASLFIGDSGFGGQEFTGRIQSLWTGKVELNQIDVERFMSYRQPVTSTAVAEQSWRSVVYLDAGRTVNIDYGQWMTHVTDDNVFWRLDGFSATDEFSARMIRQ